MKKLLLFAVVIGSIIACEKKTKSTMKDVAKDSLSINKSDIAVQSIPETCYMQATGKDTVFLKVSDNLGTIIGKMHYKNFEKDSSYGDVSGLMDGDTLKLDYTFQSEGTTSTREIWFLVKGGELMEGIAAYDETGERYKNPIDIKYSGGHVLKTADCKNFDKKLK